MVNNSSMTAFTGYTFLRVFLPGHNSSCNYTVAVKISFAWAKNSSCPSSGVAMPLNFRQQCNLTNPVNYFLKHSYSLAKACEPRAAPRCCWPYTVTVILVLAKSGSACESCSGLTIKEVFEEFKKYPKPGPAETKCCHYSNGAEVVPTAVVSSVTIPGKHLER